MKDRSDSNERQAGQLRADLAAEREALLAVVSGVGDEALAWPTRNPEWTVRDVLAHVLASDADLISLLEAAARSSSHPLAHPSLEEHQKEMARWAEATPEMFVRQLRERAERWRKLMTALPSSALAIPVSGNWWPPSALSGSPSADPESSGGVRALGEVVADWRGHDSQHAEDVRLGLADGRAGESP